MKNVVMPSIEFTLGKIDLTETEPELSNFISNIENKFGDIGSKIFGLTLLSASMYSLVNINII